MKRTSSLWERIAGVFSFKDTSVVPSSILNDGPVPLLTPRGSLGTLVYGGYPSEEYLSTLRGRARADIFDQMRRSDPQIKMCLSSVKNPIKSATWEIISGDTDEEKQDRDLIEKILFQDIDFSAFLVEALSLLDFGFAVFEPIHKPILDDPKFQSYMSLRSLAFRSPRTIERWNLEPSTGDLASVTQFAFGDIGKQVDIPASGLIVMTLEKEGANYEGISALRPCYGSWFRKNTYLKLNAIGIEKFAVPTPLVEVPDGRQNTEQYDHMIEALEAYTTHQNNYLTFPEGWKINLQTNSYDPSKVEASIDAEDKRMVKAFLANFLELGMSGTGAYALSNDLSDFFLSGLDHVAKLITAPLNQNVIPKLIQMNRGKRATYPQLKASGISDRAGKELAEVLKFLGETQYIQPDDILEEHIRKRYQLPKASTQGRRTPPAAASPMSALAGAAGGTPSTLAERIRLAELKRRKLQG